MGTILTRTVFTGVQVYAVAGDHHLYKIPIYGRVRLKPKPVEKTNQGRRTLKANFPSGMALSFVKQQTEYKVTQTLMTILFQDADISKTE